jgi:hypothetical protein
MACGTVMSSFSVEDFSVKRVSGLSKREIDARYGKYVDSLHVR